MRLAFLLIILCTSITAFGQPHPTTRPVDVAVAPFTSAGDASLPTWPATAVQKSLIADLARLHWKPAELNPGNADAITTARAVGAKYLIQGSYQGANQTMRFTGEITDLSTGSLVGGISATGNLTDLFSLEDTLSKQTAGQLHQLESIAAGTPDKPMPGQPALAAQLVADANPAPIPYQGSSLQQYVNADRPPSNDYADQLNASTLRQNYWPNYGSSGYYGYPGYYGYGGYGGYSGVFYGTSFYNSFPSYGYGGNYGYGGGFHGGHGWGR